MASSTAHAKGKFKRSLTKKSHSWWWDSHISPKNSRWLAENLQKMDESVNRMLKLIEEDADSFAQKAQMYYQKRPELIHLVEEFYRMYRALAERYDHVTGELRNFHSEIDPESSIRSQGSLELPPQLSPSTPQVLSRRRSAPDAGESPETLPNEEDAASSSLTDSDSDSDSDSEPGCVSDQSPGDEAFARRIAELELELRDVKQKLLVQQEVDFSGGDAVGDLHGKIATYESELSEANGKLGIYREEIVKLKIEIQSCKSSETLDDARLGDQQPSLGLDSEETEDAASKIRFLEEELRMAKEKLREFEEETSCLKGELEISKAANEKLQSLQHKLELAQRDAAACRNQVNAEKREVLKLQERMAMMKTSLQDRDYEIRALKTAVSDAEQKIFPEKAQIKAEMSKLLEECCDLREQLKEMESRGRSMEDDTRRMANEKAELEERLRDRVGVIEKLNRKISEISEESEGLREEVARLREGVGERDARMEEMAKHLEGLHMEQVRLRGRVKEVAEEAERTRVEMAEQKREAIRQLSVSVDHYKDRYVRLRRDISGHVKFRGRTTVLAS